MLQAETGADKGKPGFTWRDSFVCNVLEAISEAEVRVALKEGHVHELLKVELGRNGDLRRLLANQPHRGCARRIAKGDTFPRHREVILNFIKEITKEVHYN